MMNRCSNQVRNLLPYLAPTLLEHVTFLVHKVFHEGWNTDDANRPHIQHMFYVKHPSPAAQVHLQNYVRHRNVPLLYSCELFH